MGLYQDQYYNPKIVYGSSTLQFNDVNDDGTPRINILGIDRSESRRVYEHEIPGEAGKIILGNVNNGIGLSLQVEIAATSLSDFVSRRTALMAALAGGTNNKFTFFRRYVDGDNYSAFTNCCLSSLSGLDGPNDCKTVDWVDSCQGTIDITSEDDVETIMVSGSLVSGNTDLVTETSSISLYGATDFIIQNRFIVQSPFGDVVFLMDGRIPQLTITGTIEESL